MGGFLTAFGDPRDEEFKRLCASNFYFLTPTDQNICRNVLQRPFPTIDFPTEERGDSDMGGFLPGLFGTLGQSSARDRIIGGIIQTAGRVVGSFQAPTGPCVAGDTRLECQFTGAPPVTTTPGVPVLRSASRLTGGCNGSMTQGGRTVTYKGRYAQRPDGTLVCVRPTRRMNPCNPKAATRAARRLVGVMRFQKRIEKSVRKVCGGRGRSRARSSFPARKAKCCK